VPDDELVFCGISIGYAVPGSPVNQLRSERVQVDEFADFQGFGERQVDSERMPRRLSRTRKGET
jgi:hypothetical protein